MLGSAGLMRALDRVDDNVFCHFHPPPPQVPGIMVFPRQEVRHLAGISARPVQGRYTDKDRQPVLSERCCCRKERETSWMLLAPQPHEPVGVLRVLVMGAAKNPGYIAEPHEPI